MTSKLPADLAILPDAKHTKNDLARALQQTTCHLAVLSHVRKESLNIRRLFTSLKLLKISLVPWL